MKINADQDKCVAAGQCVFYAPDVFDQRDEDGVVIVLDDNPAEHQHDDVRQAAAACPALAITLSK